LLEAAAQLTYANGIDATGVDAIVKAAGVTKRTLYQHFGSKDELVAAALEARDSPAIAGLRSAVERKVSRGASPIEALFGVLARVFAEPAFQGCAFLNSGLEMHAEHHPVRPVVRSHTDARRELVADLVRAEGVDADWPIDAITLLIEGAFALSAARRDPEVIHRAQRAAESLLASARKQPSAT
jgi:AcrR family transcriptional regulator